MRRLWAALILGLLVVLGGTGPAHAAGATDVVVEDTAGALDKNTLLPGIDAINFNEPTKVAIYTRNGEYSDNLNEEVLAFARAKHPEWLSADGQKWADSLFVFALDPTGRQVGTYMGENRKVSLDQQESIQEATKDLFREAQWTDGTIAGVKRAAALMNRPWYKNPAVWGVSSLVGFAGIVTIGSNLYIRRLYGTRSKHSLADGNASYANVTMDLEVTELNARTIPDSSRYGHLVLEKYRDFQNHYGELTTLANQANDLTAKEKQRKQGALTLKRYAAEAARLDGIDDVIADTNTFLNMGSGWEAAWDRQLAPLKEDLAGITQLLAAKHAVPKSATALALTSFAAQTLKDIESWGAQLTEGASKPEDALDKILETRKELTGLLRKHSETVIANYAKNNTEASLMRAAMRTPKAGSLRNSSTNSILGTVYPANQFWSVVGFSSGFNSGRSSVQEARNPSSSSGSSTGYGSSGGSFSGSGSSSRF